jgi:hypothetical protein
MNSDPLIPEDSDLRRVRMLIDGYLSEDKYGVLELFAGNLVVNNDIEVVNLAPEEIKLLSLEELEERYDTRYMTPSIVDGQETLLVTFPDFGKLLRDKFGISRKRVENAWDALEYHFRMLHDRDLIDGDGHSVGCACSMTPIFYPLPSDRRNDHRRGLLKLYGTTPNGLVENAADFGDLYTGVNTRRAFHPSIVRTIQLFSQGIQEK